VNKIKKNEVLTIELNRRKKLVKLTGTREEMFKDREKLNLEIFKRNQDPETLTLA
jgi:hypothetical protein